MAIYLSELYIDHFRGINYLEVTNLNHINIIAGDNNSGKSSVLESLLLLRAPTDFNNILRIARMRDTRSFLNATSLYENFLNLFPKDRNELELSLKAVCRNIPLSCKLTGHQKKIMMEPGYIQNLLYEAGQVYSNPKYISNEMIEADAFYGKLSYDIDGIKNTTNVSINAYESASGREIINNEYLNTIYLSPVDHVSGNIFGRIIRSSSYKEICLHVLQLFDADIIDLLILKNEDEQHSVEYVKHKRLGIMPLSTYGDGIKKVLLLANGITQAAGGILLIDEIETAIHSKYYVDVFSFLIKACLQFNVQVFITTHNMEAIDALLDTQDYAHQKGTDNISVLTFKKQSAGNNTLSRILKGRNVYNNRENFGFEVRL